MTGRLPDGAERDPVPAERAPAYRRAASRPPVAAQVERLLAALAALEAVQAAGETRIARGAALSIAHAALVLAVTPAASDADRHRRREALHGTVLPRLAAAGLGHVRDLVEAALARDVDAAAVVGAHAPRQ